MTQKRTTSQMSGGRRKRPPPTIDLAATEVRSARAAPPAPPAPDAPAPDPPAPDPPAPESDSATPESGARAQPSQTHAASSDDVGAGSDVGDADVGAGGDGAGDGDVGSGGDAGAVGDGGDGARVSSGKGRGGRTGAAVAGGVAGAAVAAAAAAALWYGGLMPPRGGGADADALRGQLAAVQEQVRQLQDRPAGGDALAALQRRIDSMEQTLARLPAGDASVAERLSAADNALRSLGVALTALNRRSDDIAAKAAQAEEQAAAAQKAIGELRASVQGASGQASGAVAPDQLADIRQRVAALEQALETVRGELGRTSDALQERMAQAGAADRAARLALSASLLQNAVASGAPYAAELAQAKALGAEPQAVAALDAFAASGIPDKAELAKRLLEIIPAMRKIAAPDDRGGSFLDRLQANAGKLVRIRPVEAPEGDAPADVLTRIEEAAAREDTAGALADLARLPPEVQAPAKDWIATAKAREAALAAAQRFAAETARALGSG